MSYIYIAPNESIPQKFKLLVNVAGFENSWDFWIYTSNIPNLNTDSRVYVTQQLDQNSKGVLEQGGNVLLTLKKGSIRPDKGGNIGVGFSIDTPALIFAADVKEVNTR